MRKLSYLLIVLVCFITAIIGSQKSHSDENKENLTFVDFKTTDIQKREINTADLRGKILLIGVSVEDTSEHMIEWQTEVGYHTGITMDGYDEIVIISIADVSSFSRFMRPFARRVLKGTHKKANKRLLERFEENNTEPPEDIQDRVNFIPDWSGDIVKSLGIADKADKRDMFVVDHKGKIVAHFSENTKDNKDKTYSIVQNLLNKIKK